MARTRRFRVEKLIRDRLPQSMRGVGLAVFERRLDGAEFERALREKLIEEAAETAAAATREALQYELADVLEVVRALAGVHNLSMDDIEAARLDKRARRGGFEERIYTMAVAARDGAPALSYYIERPEQYREIGPDEPF